MPTKEILSLRPFMLPAFLQKRIFPGFKTGEGLAWLAFHISWATVLGGLYYFTGQFELPDFYSQEQFLYTQAYVLIVKAIFIIPFWWLYFIRLRTVPLHIKLLLHIFTGSLYTLLSVGLIYTIKAEILNGNYPLRAVVGDVYAMLVSYYTHFGIFHAYNFWLDTKRRMAREQELKDLAHQSELKALKSQIQPHFLFNTLNSISASVAPEQENTRVLIAKLADTFRYGLSISERNTVPLSEELEFIKTWLSLEQNRFHERLTIHYSIDENVLQTPIPPMLLQPLVENALNHGIAPKIEGGMIAIECHRSGNFVLIAVSDSGEGYNGAVEQIFKQGIGLSNTSNRLQLLYNEPIIVEQLRPGMRFSFKIPIPSTDEKKSNDHR